MSKLELPLTLDMGCRVEYPNQPLSECLDKFNAVFGVGDANIRAALESFRGFSVKPDELYRASWRQ